MSVRSFNEVLTTQPIRHLLGVRISFTLFFEVAISKRLVRERVGPAASVRFGVVIRVITDANGARLI